MNKTCYIILLLFIFPGSGICSTVSGDGRLAAEDTMLMFVGEDIEALTIASRREESAWQAPAVAQVVSREQIREQGLTTVAEALDTLPGFDMVKKPWGSSPYLRGIANSTLFLYDTVPLGADSDKGLQQLDYNLSLAAIKRIEIIRGPGSVLWGPDAFAGIVNVVPMSGRDLEGVEGGILAEIPRGGQGGFVNLGHAGASWDGFISLSGRGGRRDNQTVDLVRFWGDDPEGPVAAGERHGAASPGDSDYLEAVALFSYRDYLRVSGRFADSRQPYAVSDGINGSWTEERNISSSFLKLEASRPLGLSSSLRFTGFYNLLRPEYRIIDRDFAVREETDYAELIFDRSLMTGRGLFTGGLSYRGKRVDNVTVWEGYLPDFLGEANEDLLPLFEVEDYRDDLWSGFAQYSQVVDRLKVWLGLRYDAHDRYRDNLSFNGGAGYSLSPDLVVKLLYGTAYRTPSSRQLHISETPEQEKIATLEAQIVYNPARRLSFSLAAFSSRIEDHVKEDPYAQLSLANRQDIVGVEFDGRLALTRNFSLGASFTALNNTGPDESYHLLSAVFIRPDGSVENIYEDIETPYDTGAKTMFDLNASWTPLERFSVSADLQYRGEREFIDGRTGYTAKADPYWLTGLSARLKDFIPGLADLRLVINNLFGSRYESPGNYELIEGDPSAATVILERDW